MQSILVLGDLHMPYHSVKALNEVYRIAKVNKPGIIVQIGDLYDMFSVSKFPRNRDIILPQDEITTARCQAEMMWLKFKQMLPNTTLYQIRGNHDIRAERRILEKVPEMFSLLSPKIMELYRFKGVSTTMDHREELKINGMWFQHGTSTQPGFHCRTNNACTIVGHSHKGYTVFPSDKLWELNAGFLGDHKSPVFGYTMQKTTKWTLGVGWIDDYGPRFLPLGE